nr:tetratricopeptide repeat protein [Prochloraceae cyanobacterium]
LLDLPTAKNGHRSFWNGIQVLSWDINRPKIPSWKSFTSNFRDRNVIQSIYDLHFYFEFNKKPEIVQNLNLEAARLIEAGKLEAAEQKYFEALEWHSNNAYILHDLGLLYFQQSRYRDAILMLNKSLQLDGTQSKSYYSTAIIQQALKNDKIAIELYRKAIELDEKFIDAYLNLGNLLVTAKQFAEAESVYRQALSLDPPKKFAIYTNLGNILMDLKKFNEAKECYEKALKLNPEDADIINNFQIVSQILESPVKADWLLGRMAQRKGKYNEAISHFKKYLEIHPDELNCYWCVSVCYEELDRLDRSIEFLKQGIDRYDRTDSEISRFYLHLVFNLHKIGKIKEAQNYAERAAQLFPDDLLLQQLQLYISPLIYNTVAEINSYRDRFEKYLNRLIENANLVDEEKQKNALIAVCSLTNFYLNYQGKNDTAIQKKYGKFIHQVMAANYPDLVKPLPMPSLADGEKIRVGYISGCFRNHSVSKLFLGWLENHDRQKFEIYCYYPHDSVDNITTRYKLASNSFVQKQIFSEQVDPELKLFCEQIIADRLHVLVFFDIGQLPTVSGMAGLRLAPIQCQTWAHPITSGIPTIDYFLSGDLMEPENGQSHYSETLIRLPNVGVFFTKPNLPENRKQRSDFKLPEDAILYLCCQIVLKYLPQYDYIFAAIAAEVPNAKFVFLSRSEAEVMDRFKARLQKAFAQFSLDSEEYCIVLPKLNFTDYLNLNLLSDIFLDSFAWSGGVTTMEAIACNLPVVTCPGEFMRGRHAYGILQMLGVTETIAQNEQEYIEIAIRLAKNPDLRNNIRQQIANHHSRLYNDLTCIRAVEDFYQRVVREYSL